MKLNYSLLWLIPLLLVGCQKIDIEKDLSPSLSSKSLQVNDAKYNVGLKTATYLASILSKKEIKRIEPIVYSGKDTVMFIVSYKDGWVVLSGDKRATPILAKSDKGNFESQVENPGSAIWFNEAANEILALKKSTAVIDENKVDKKDYNFWMKMERAANADKLGKLIRRPDMGENGQFYLCKKLVTTTLTNDAVKYTGPYVITNWGQEYPWNTNLPGVWDSKTSDFLPPPTGCVAVAIAQMLHFTHYKLNMPTGLFHYISSTGKIYDGENFSVSFERKDYVENSPRWDQMPLNKYWGSNFSYVADLMADVGNRVGMKYSLNASGANISQSGMQSYGLTYDEKDYTSNEVLAQLRGGMPLMVTAYAGKHTSGWWLWKKTHYTGGHAWIINGIADNTKSFEYKYEWVVEFGNNSDQLDPNDPTQLTGTKTYYQLLSEYEEVIPESEGPARGVHMGYEETTTSQYTTTNLLMNWGWNGGHDGEYSPYTSVWTISGVDRNNKPYKYDYQYQRKIYCNIRKNQ